ncbi:MAG: ADP-ribosyl-[dinitrogen reductase] hydrolase [Zoogloeaceae bacterium]|jgi:ADP-ribosyl-[dinitrogen reductase] hydrolase|nr:ADP-ribosyl-[dinitrogen reductase] hydrolase [Zoogloeaceae bacterium]
MPTASAQKPETNAQAEYAKRARGAYLGLAVGDALGATVEFLTPREIRCNFARQGGVHKEIAGGGWLHLRPGQVTDDTAMSLALGEAILANGGKVEALASALAFDRWMHAKPIDIGNTVRRNLIRFRQTGIPEAPESEHDAGNGAVMRLLPVALCTVGRGEAEIIAALKAQAHVTHNNPISDAGCLCLTRMLHLALRGGARAALEAEAMALESIRPEYAWSEAGRMRMRRRENPSAYVAHTLAAVFQAFFSTDGFESCLIDVVNRGGDADTTGAIAGALAGAWYGENQIPPRWKNALDKTIARRCEEQAEALGIRSQESENSRERRPEMNEKP